jgi:hypothetical protein
MARVLLGCNWSTVYSNMHSVSCWIFLCFCIHAAHIMPCWILLPFFDIGSNFMPFRYIIMSWNVLIFYICSLFADTVSMSGSYSVATGQQSIATCTQCPAGSFCASVSTLPTSCPAGYYCLSSTSAPTQCPSGTFS